MMYAGYGGGACFVGQMYRDPDTLTKYRVRYVPGQGYHVYSARQERHWVWMLDKEFDWMPNADAAIDELERIMDDAGIPAVEGYGFG